jgi:hypothetical protein
MVGSLGAGLLAAVLGPLAPANTVFFVARAPDGHGARVQITAVLDAPLEDVHAIVVNFPGYTQWFPTLQSVQPRATAGEYDAVFRLPWPLRTVRERLAIVSEPLPGALVVRWNQIEGDFARDEGRWTLRAADGGRTTVHYESFLQFRRWVPTWMVARAERRFAPQILKSIEARAQEHARGRREAARAAR